MGFTKLELIQCPFNLDHKGSGFLVDAKTGRIGFKCFHDSCEEYKFPDAYEKLLGAKPPTHKGIETDLISDLNAKHAVGNLKGKCVILNESWDPVSNRMKITFSMRMCLDILS